MPVSHPRLVLLPLLVTGYAASCAVFPDEAVLPAVSNTDAGRDGGGGNNETAGAAGSALTAGSPATSAGAGAGGGASAGAGTGGGGGSLEAGGGAGEGGAAGAGIATCDEPQQLVVPGREETWIDAADEDANHADEAQVLVSGGAAERRALLKLDLPAAPAGAWLVKATLDLNLESNQDGTLAQRTLGLHRLTVDYVEDKATWLNYASGANKRWQAPGGDFGSILARATLPAETPDGTLSFDVTKPLSLLYSAQAVPLALIVREVGAAPPTPSALAFASSGGNASVPTLTIEYCEP